MKIIIKTLTGEAYSVDTDNFENIYDLKVNLTCFTGFEPHNQKLIFCGQELTNEIKISDIIGLEKSTCFHLVHTDNKNKKIPRTEKKIIEELQVKVLSLEDRIDKLENKKILEVKNEKLEENIPYKEDFKKWVSNMICNLDSREGHNNLKYKTVNYNNNGQFSIHYEYRT